jgi:hypothetical protein
MWPETPLMQKPSDGAVIRLRSRPDQPLFSTAPPWRDAAS